MSRWRLGLVIALAVLGICIWGTMVGATLPLVFKKFGGDPAVASGPFVATFVDITGIAISSCARSSCCCEAPIFAPRELTYIAQGGKPWGRMDKELRPEGAGVREEKRGTIGRKKWLEATQGFRPGLPTSAPLGRR